MTDAPMTLDKLLMLIDTDQRIVIKQVDEHGTFDRFAGSLHDAGSYTALRRIAGLRVTHITFEHQDDRIVIVL